MGTKTIGTISVDELLQIWEKNFHALNFRDRKEFKAHPDALKLTSFSKFEIERAIKIGRAKFLKDILKYLRKNEFKRAPKKSFQPARQIETLRDFERIIPTETPTYYVCSLWQVHLYGQSCVCGRDD